MTTVTYCKRLRMEIKLQWIDDVPPLPMGFVWAPWNESTLQSHARVKWLSFRGETDSLVFRNLANLDGCVQLMHAISGRPGFVPAATWLVAAPNECCGTIQGVRDEFGVAMIQNLGVVPQYRGLGLGKALLLKALHGFRQEGDKKASLEVTARNLRAVRLYHQMGFVIQKTLYRELERSTEAESFAI